jgi:hypothetical protein
MLQRSFTDRRHLTIYNPLSPSFHRGVTEFWFKRDMAERIIQHASTDNARATAFIDLEASGLGARSWPVEIGWAFADGTADSFLVRPDPSWTDDAWDRRAESLHGISREILEREGIDARDACLRLNAALGGVKVFSDAPDWDGFWLFRLFSASGVRQAFQIQDFGRLVRPLAGVREEALLARAARIAPRRHRAKADALHLQTLYRLAAEGAPPIVGK